MTFTTKKCSIKTARRDPIQPVFHYGLTTNVKGTINHDCSCCEYRQFIQGKILATLDGMSLPTELNHPKWTEDIIKHPPPSTPYGHRSESNRLIDFYYAPSLPPIFGPADETFKRRFGCKYFAEDNPGYYFQLKLRTNVGKILKVTVDLAFTACIVNVCKEGKNITVKTCRESPSAKHWLVACEDKIKIGAKGPVIVK